MTAVLICSTCDGYEFVPGADGLLLVRCPDCADRCLAHHASPVVAGLCGACVHEASLAVELLQRAGEARERLLSARALS